MKTNWGIFLLLLFFPKEVIPEFKWELIWGNLAAGFKADDHMGFTVLITSEPIYLCKAPYSKYFPLSFIYKAPPLLKVLSLPQNWQGEGHSPASAFLGCWSTVCIAFHVSLGQQLAAGHAWVPASSQWCLLGPSTAHTPFLWTWRTCPSHCLLWSFPSLFLSQSESKYEEISRLVSPNTLPLCIWNSSFSLNNIL